MEVRGVEFPIGAQAGVSKDVVDGENEVAWEAEHAVYEDFEGGHPSIDVTFDEDEFRLLCRQVELGKE